MIQSGDTCKVVAGLGRSKSPNIGLTVKVVSAQGEHSTLGRVWRCAGDGVCQLSDAGSYVTTGWADFPAAWLVKIDPIKPTAETKTEQELGL